MLESPEARSVLFLSSSFGADDISVDTPTFAIAAYTGEKISWRPSNPASEIPDESIDLDPPGTFDDEDDEDDEDDDEDDGDDDDDEDDDDDDEDDDDVPWTTSPVA